MQFEISLIRELEKLFDLPLYVFDEKEFRDNYQEFESCFKSFYSNYRVSYSYKTNYTPYVCKIVKEMGGYAEVVSGMEYSIAKKIGYNDDKIIFNGPDKGYDGLNALLNGSIVNIDNIDELKRIVHLAENNSDKNIKIGFRVNMSIAQNFISRFGMDCGDLEKAFTIVSEVKNINVVGLHCHISRCRGRADWRKRTEIMLSYADKYFEEPPEYIDLGSGMYGKMEPEFAEQFSGISSYKEYAEVTAKLVADHYSDISECKKPILFTEPGTTLVNKYFYVIGKVDAIKQINGKFFAILNCGEHILGETCILKQLPVKVFNNCSECSEYDAVDFTGYTCLEQDVMYRNYKGKLSVGDYVVFGNTGGYSNVYKPPFINPNCAMISVKPSGEHKLIRRSESYDDILNSYLF